MEREREGDVKNRTTVCTEPFSGGIFYTVKKLYTYSLKRLVPKVKRYKIEKKNSFEVECFENFNELSRMNI